MAKNDRNINVEDSFQEALKEELGNAVTGRSSRVRTRKVSFSKLLTMACTARLSAWASRRVCNGPMI